MAFLGAAYEPHCVIGQNTEIRNERAFISPLLLFLSRSVVSDYLRPHRLQHATLFLSITNSRSLLKLMSIESVMPSNHLILCHPLQCFPESGSFLVIQFFASGGQSIGASASASVLRMNIQDWFPLGWTGWISLQSKGLTRVFSNTTVQKHQFSSAQLFFNSPTLTSIHDYWKNHTFD